MERLRETIGAIRAPADRPGHERCVADARAGLDPGTWDAAWTAARAMLLEEAVRDALAAAEAIDGTSRPS